MAIAPRSNTRKSGAEYESTELLMVRRVGRESITMIGGGRATLMQLAHPLIAAGVNEHSYFLSDPMTRLAQTMRMMLTIVFGNQEQVRRAIRQFNAVHSHVHGSLPGDYGRFLKGYRYTARDPKLRLWVHATLIDTSLLVYDRFVCPLTTADRARFYAESKVIGGWLGIPHPAFPPSLHDFELYMQNMVDGDTLDVTQTARMLAHAVMHPKAGLLPRSSVRLVLFPTAGLLPDRLREDYNMKWSPSQERLLQAISRFYRIARPLAPKSIALMPQTGGGQLIDFALRQYRFDGQVSTFSRFP